MNFKMVGFFVLGRCLCAAVDGHLCSQLVRVPYCHPRVPRHQLHLWYVNSVIWLYPYPRQRTTSTFCKLHCLQTLPTLLTRPHQWTTTMVPVVPQNTNVLQNIFEK